VNELVRDDAQLLEGKRLHFGAGEALDDPGLVALLDLFYFCLDEFDNDLIVDYKNKKIKTYPT